MSSLKQVIIRANEVLGVKESKEDLKFTEFSYQRIGGSKLLL